MRFIDLIVQTLILIFGGSLLILMWSDQSWPMGPLLLIQLILGPWQMLSSLVSLIAYANFHKAKKWHLIVALLYLIFLSLCFSTTIFEFDHSVLNLILTVPAWILACITTQ